MMPLMSLPPFVADGMALVCLVLAVVSAYVLVEAMMLRLRRVRIYSLVTLLASAYLSRALLLVWYWRGWESSPAARVLSAAPALVSVTLVVGVLVATVLLVLRVRSERHARITPDSVKEALDALPDGVVFSMPDGEPVLVNTQMDAIAHDAFGTPVTDETALWERLVRGDVLPGFSVERVGIDEVLLVGPDGRAWRFSRMPLGVDGADVVETIATDVTEEHALLGRLEERNRQMAAVNERLREYGRDLTRLTREAEVLAAKVHVHDEVGRALVALRVYEMQAPELRDREALLALWGRVARLLETAGADDDSPTDAWVLLCEAAKAIDVRISLEGELPSEGRARSLVVMVVHECLNNAVRHGGAHEVLVRCSEADGMVDLAVENDGNPPEVTPVESGGLVNMREAVSQRDGMLSIQWMPRVVVTARFASGG